MSSCGKRIVTKECHCLFHGIVGTVSSLRERMTSLSGLADQMSFLCREPMQRWKTFDSQQTRQLCEASLNLCTSKNATLVVVVWFLGWFSDASINIHFIFQAKNRLQREATAVKQSIPKRWAHSKERCHGMRYEPNDKYTSDNAYGHLHFMRFCRTLLNVCCGNHKSNSASISCAAHACCLFSVSA